MADKENCVRFTRAAVKRAASSSSVSTNPLEYLAQQHPPAKRKRVALKELPNLSNIAASRPSLDLNHPLPLMPGKKIDGDGEQKVPSVDPIATLDADPEADDPQMCADNYHYLRSMELEPKRRPGANFIQKVQIDVTTNMRAVLVDWLVEVAEEYDLVVETLYLTISYIDRFLSINTIGRRKLQLLGVSAMLIASKYEEINPRDVKDFCYITDNTYSKQEVVKMESDILKVLNFEMGNPTINSFLMKFTRAAQEDLEHPNLELEFLVRYLAELSLLDYGCIQLIPSLVAASALFLARFTINPKTQPWNKMLQQSTGYRPSELKDCICAIHDLQVSRKGSSLVGVREKYRQPRFKCLSTMLPPFKIPTSYFEDIED